MVVAADGKAAGHLCSVQGGKKHTRLLVVVQMRKLSQLLHELAFVPWIQAV